MKDKITNELKNAMKNKDIKKRDTLRIVLSNIQNAEIKNKSKLSDDDLISIIKKDIKDYKELINHLESLDKSDDTDFKINEANRMVDMLSEFLPKQLTHDEILKLMLDGGSKEGTPIGKIIGPIMKQYKSVVDANLVRTLAVQVSEGLWN